MDKNVPEIRFKGFTTKWEQKKLGEIANIIDPHPSHRAPEETKEGVPFIGIGDVDVDGTINYHNVRIVDEKEYEEHHRRYDLAIPSLGIGRVASLGKVIRLRNDIGKYTVSPTLSIMQFNTSSDLDFLFSAMSSPLFQKQFTSLSNGSTRQSVGIQDLRAIEISISSCEGEQKEIGSFFKSMDDLISLETRELDKLITLKKLCLKKMFPKDGETVPEIRFKGFEGPWERKTLGDLMSLGNGRDYKHLQYGSVPVYGTGGYMTSVNDSLCDKDSIGIGRKGTIDKPYILKAPFWTVDTLFYATPKEGVDLYYLFGLFQIIDWKSKDESTGVPSLSKQNINGIETYSSSNILEQRKIGIFFNKLDNDIELLHQKLDKLKFLKQACLEKMFV